jgi:hypothetical protein
MLRASLLSALLCLSAAVDLRQFLRPGSSCYDETGFELRTLQHIWDTYHAYRLSAPGTFGGQLEPVQRGGLDRRAYQFFCVFVYIHKCPQTNWHESFALPGGYTMNNLVPMRRVADALADIICEIVYDDRLDLYNHAGPPFEYHVTALVDVFPVFVPAPHEFSLRRLLFQPKYDACVLKIQLGISLLGNIILWTGPHLGVTSDKTIWDQTWAAHPFKGWEWWLADLGYVGALGLLYKYKRAAQRRGQPPPPPLSVTEVFYNNVHEWYRNRVEQIVDVVKSHRIFAPRVYQGSYAHLAPLVTIIGHAHAYELRVRQRFVGFGPWQHAY